MAKLRKLLVCVGITAFVHHNAYAGDDDTFTQIGQFDLNNLCHFIPRDRVTPAENPIAAPAQVWNWHQAAVSICDVMSAAGGS